MNKKCVGCGAVMQYDKPEVVGYIEPEMYEKSNICKRCFRLKFYGDYIFVQKSKDDFEDILKSISDTGDLVVYMVDIFNINEELINVDKLLNNPMILVLSKRDIMPRSVKDDKVLKYLNHYNLDIIDKICISSEKNYNIDRLYKMILKHKKSNNVYIVGNTNAGKSSLINHLIKKYSNNNVFITTSMLPTTTLDIMKIELNNKLTIIDTPGFVEDGNIINYYDYTTLKRIIPRAEIKPRIYQIDPGHSILIDSFAQIDYLEGDKNSFVLYFSNELTIECVKLNYKVRFTKNKNASFNVKKGEDVVISGLGWIKVVNDAVIDIYANEKVKIYTRDSII